MVGKDVLGFGDFGDEDLVFEDADLLRRDERVIFGVFGKKVSFVVSAALLDFIVDEERAELWDHSEKINWKVTLIRKGGHTQKSN